MELRDGFEAHRLCLYVSFLDTLVIGDVHLGYEESLAKQGVFLPKFQFDEIMEHVTHRLEELEPSTTVVVGDLKHEFGDISDEEWRDTLTFIDTIQKKSELILIKGNHDTLLEPITDQRDVTVTDCYKDDGVAFLHGHTVPNGCDEADTIIMGHEHPAVGLREGARVELYKCFLVGEYKDSAVIVVPSVSSMPEGTDVTQERLRSPFIQDVNSFETFVVGADEVYAFGPVRDISDAK